MWQSQHTAELQPPTKVRRFIHTLALTNTSRQPFKLAIRFADNVRKSRRPFKHRVATNRTQAVIFFG
jgi:hypothetical protein